MQANEQQNPYIFGDADTDRFRMETQARLFIDYLRGNAQRLIGENLRSILDLGSGEGQLALVLHEIYPQARIVCIDKDEKAIAKAQQQAEAVGADNIEYVIGDVQQDLPDGPFDLVYASMVMQHIPDTDGVLNSIYARLNPGGYIWIKAADTKAITGYDNAAYQQLMRLFYGTVDKLGAHSYLPDYIADKLQEHGFTDVRTEFEQYPLGGSTPDGWAMMGITLGMFHNTQKMMAKMNNLSEDELTRLYTEVVNDASTHRNKEGVQTFRDTIGRKPEE